MARQNNIPQFDSSDTNVSEAPANGFSANTTIASAQVNSAIRWSSFAITALLNAIAENTENTASYEYAKDGATGLDKLKTQLASDFESIVKKYTFTNGGTFLGTVAFKEKSYFNNDIVFPYNDENHGIITNGNVTGSLTNRKRDVVKTYADSSSDTDYFYQYITSERYTVPISPLADETKDSTLGIYKFKFEKSNTSTPKSGEITIPSGTYTLRPYYTHHISMDITPDSGNTTNIKNMSLYLTITLPNNNKLNSINQIYNSLDDKPYVASGIVNINNTNWCSIYLFIPNIGLIYYLNNGSNTTSLKNYKWTYVIKDEVVSYD